MLQAVSANDTSVTARMIRKMITTAICVLGSKNRATSKPAAIAARAHSVKAGHRLRS